MTEMTITLTAIQTEWVDWALPAVEQYFLEIDQENEQIAVRDLPVLTGNVLALHSDPDAADELAVRLEWNACDMLQSAPDNGEMTRQQATAQIRSLTRLAETIREMSGSQSLSAVPS